MHESSWVTDGKRGVVVLTFFIYFTLDVTHRLVIFYRLAKERLLLSDRIEWNTIEEERRGEKRRREKRREDERREKEKRREKRREEKRREEKRREEKRREEKRILFNISIHYYSTLNSMTRREKCVAILHDIISRQTMQYNIIWHNMI